MRILITGSRGVLGTALKQELRSRGFETYGCDLMHSDDQQEMRADISEYRQIQRAFAKFKPDVVYNFAGEFGRVNGGHFYEDLWKTNCTGLQNVIEECVRTSATLIHASSSEAYGLAEEYTKGKLHESLLDKFPPKHHNIYALSKYVNERQIHMAVRNNDLRAVILRFFNVYGPPEKYNPYRSVVCQLAYQILAGLPVKITKDGYRSHLWIGDWANTVANLADRVDQVRWYRMSGSAGTPNTPVFNIGGDNYESIETVFNKLVEIIKPANVNVTYVETEVANSATKRPDNRRAKAYLGHKPNTPLDEGLRNTVEWLMKEYGF